MANTPMTLRRVMRWWPPYLGAGVRVVDADAEGRHLTVEHRVTRWTRNAFGTAFGGTMSSMTDPFFCLLVAHRLGSAPRGTRRGTSGSGRPVTDGCARRSPSPDADLATIRATYRRRAQTPALVSYRHRR